MLWVYALAYILVSATAPDGELAMGADMASTVALPLIMAAWVTADAHRRGRRLCYDHDSFVFFAWPVVVPVYLFQTRGVRAFITLACFAGIWLAALLAALLIYVVREFVS